MFSDRQDAGRRLAKALSELDLGDPVVLALPRGGVPVAFEIAMALKAPLDLLLVRKIGAPGHAELGLGAVASGREPQIVRNEDVIGMVQPPADYFEAEAQRQIEEIERRRKIYLGERPAINTAGRTAILVDDGIATGGTVKAAFKALRGTGPTRIVLAVPVAPASVVAALKSHADTVICLETPEPFRAVGVHYARFDQTSDQEVIELMEKARLAIPANTG